MIPARENHLAGIEHITRFMFSHHVGRDHAFMLDFQSCFRARPSDDFTDGGIAAFPSGDMVVSARFVRFCMLYDGGGDMLAGAFAK